MKEKLLSRENSYSDLGSAPNFYLTYPKTLEINSAISKIITKLFILAVLETLPFLSVPQNMAAKALSKVLFKTYIKNLIVLEVAH